MPYTCLTYAPANIDPFSHWRKQLKFLCPLKITEISTDIPNFRIKIHHARPSIQKKLVRISIWCRKYVRNPFKWKREEWNKSMVFKQPDYDGVKLVPPFPYQGRHSHPSLAPNDLCGEEKIFSPAERNEKYKEASREIGESRSWLAAQRKLGKTSQQDPGAPWRCLFYLRSRFCHLTDRKIDRNLLARSSCLQFVAALFGQCDSAGLVMRCGVVEWSPWRFGWLLWTPTWWRRSSA